MQGGGKEVVCVLCETAFKAEQSFNCLKLGLRRHLNLVTHKEKVVEKDKAAETEEKREMRKRKIDKTIGGLVSRVPLKKG